MARRAQPVALSLAAGLAGAAIAALVLGTLAAVALRAEAPGGLARADWRAAGFTLMQATLSAALSCLLAVPLARALSRRRFPGRGAAITALGAPFLLPVAVAVFGLLALFGRNGLANAALTGLGLPPLDIYGLTGILLAHVFFNLPLATRFLLHGWSAIPPETFRLAASLDLSDRALFRTVELPMLRAVLPGAFVSVFLLCLTSFAVVLALGGGPKATTIELAIYEAFRFEFDLSRAALLALVQLGIGLAAAVLALTVPQPEPGRGLELVARRWDGRGWRRAADAALIVLALVFLAAPILVVAGRGGAALATLPDGLLGPTLRTLAVALSATALTFCLAMPLALRIGAGRASAAGRGAELIGALPLAASPLILGTGLFVLLNSFLDPVSLSLPITALVNAMMALPFALRALIPAAVEAHQRFDRLSDSLDLPFRTRLRHVILPRMRQPLGFSLGLAAALSAGDLGVLALFSTPDQATLPLAIYAMMSAYRTDAAAAAGLILIALAFGLFLLFDKGIGRARA